LTVAAALHLAALAVETLDFVPGRNEDIVINLAHSNSKVNELDGDNICHWTRLGVAVAPLRLRMEGATAVVWMAVAWRMEREAERRFMVGLLRRLLIGWAQ
jgi:hypothetical protein